MLYESAVVELTGISFQDMFEGFIHRHRRQALLNKIVRISEFVPINYH